MGSRRHESVFQRSGRQPVGARHSWRLAELPTCTKIPAFECIAWLLKNTGRIAKARSSGTSDGAETLLLSVNSIEHLRQL